jgi:hypothetical protein
MTDLDDDLEMDEEGFIDNTTPKGRAANYTAAKDIVLSQLGRSKVGMEPVIGTNEPKDTYWVRMKEY